jgi:tRNA (guanine-N7-)-methyltransferase
MSDRLLTNGERPAGYEQLIIDRRRRLAHELLLAFPDPAEIICEIGSGHGHFLTAYAQVHPDHTCVGVDIIGERIIRAIRKRDRARLKHLHFYHAEARLFLEALPPSVRIGKVFILFPDPWPKTRHHKHRILQPEFLTLLRSRVTDHAELFFRTDHHSYFENAMASMRAHPSWQLTDARWPFEHETVFQKRAAIYHSFSAMPQP